MGIGDRSSGDRERAKRLGAKVRLGRRLTLKTRENEENQTARSVGVYRYEWGMGYDQPTFCHVNGFLDNPSRPKNSVRFLLS